MSRPLVSIGIPTWNRASLLRESLASIRAQDYPSLEIVISDNASTDETEALCRRAAETDSRIRYFRQPRNIGLYPNLNFCLDQSRGELLCSFHDDDLYEPTIISRYVEFLEAHASVGIVCSDWLLIDDDARPFGTAIHSVPGIEPGLAYISRTIAQCRSSVGCPGMMVRRDALGSVRFDETGPLGFGDFVVWFRVAEKHAVGHVRAPLWQYRQHARSFSRRTVLGAMTDYERQIRQYCESVPARRPDLAADAQRWRKSMEKLIFWALVYEHSIRKRGESRTSFERTDYELTQDERRECWRRLRALSSGHPLRHATTAILAASQRTGMQSALAWLATRSGPLRGVLRPR